MSQSSKRFKAYNRMEEKEEVFYWLELLFAEEHRTWDELDEFGPWGIDWWDYEGSGIVHTMDELNQMHLLTLLRKFNIRTATKEASDRGW